MPGSTVELRKPLAPQWISAFSTARTVVFHRISTGNLNISPSFSPGIVRISPHYPTFPRPGPVIPRIIHRHIPCLFFFLSVWEK